MNIYDGLDDVNSYLLLKFLINFARRFNTFNTTTVNYCTLTNNTTTPSCLTIKQKQNEKVLTDFFLKFKTRILPFPNLNQISVTFV